MNLTKDICMKQLEIMVFEQGYLSIEDMLKSQICSALPYQIMYQLINEHFELVEETNSLENQLVECQRVCKQKQEMIDELKSNPPLKFEELHEDMWVWDNKEIWWRKIVILFKPCKEYIKGSFKSWSNSGETCLDFVEFEENRFYRYEVKEND